MPDPSVVDKEDVGWVEASSREDRLVGLLLGLALGDALGLPYEGLSRRRTRRFRGAGPLRHRFIWGRGMCSDDTEHACMVAQALLASGGQGEAFARSLAWRLRGWLAGLPAGTGMATMRSIARLWLGFGPERSGVFSAGNGPAMRSPLIGACYAHTPEQMADLVLRSTRITHTDPKAYHGALLIARAAAAAMALPPASEAPAGSAEADASSDLDEAISLWAALYESIEEPELQALCQPIEEALRQGMSCEAFAASMGLSEGVTGYMYHTVPVVMFGWLRWRRDLPSALTAMIELGGDTDTTAAIVGALVGAGIGASQMPSGWLDGLWEWPRTAGWLQRLGSRLALATPLEPSLGPGSGSEATEDRLAMIEDGGPLSLCWPGLLPRNLFFLAVVLGHGFRRLLPPYG